MQTVGFARVANRILRDVREHTYRHLQTLSLNFHNHARNGDLTVRVTRDVSMLRDVVSTAILPLVANALLLVGMLMLMLWLQWKLALLAISTLPLFWLMTIKLTRSIHQAARKQRRREGEMAATAAESIAAIKDVQALSLESMFSEGFSGQNRKSQKQDVQTARLSAQLERSVDLLLAISTALVVWYGGGLVLSRQLSPGELVVFLTYLKRAFRPARDFAKFSGRLAKAAAAGERVVELLEQTPEVQDCPNAVAAPVFEGRVTFEQVSFAYLAGCQVLKEIDLDVGPGRRIAIVGESGIGKSTLISLLMRLYEPQEGRLLIDGEDIRQFKVESLRRQIGVVLQDSIVFATSLRENIRCGTEVTEEQIETAARLANAHDFIMALPDGYDTVPGERGVTLSRGQRQRLAIARTAVRLTPILLLDEPTTGLDAQNKQTVIEALDRLSTDRTTFLITHDQGLLCLADEVLRLNQAGLTTSPACLNADRCQQPVVIPT
ncbi:MAG: ABC transporter ATP-binding protein [Planctomycetaceae bacterium]